MSLWNSLSKRVLEKTFEVAGKVDGGRDYVAAATNKVNVLVKGKSPRNYLKPGNIIQFLSRSSTRTIQIVVSNASNELVCDAIGGIGSLYPNAHWSVVCSPTGRFYFHNNYNYLAIKAGQIVIIPWTAQGKPPIEAEFLVQDVLGSSEAIYIESAHMLGHVLSFDAFGRAIPFKKFMVNDVSSQFGIHVIAHGPGIGPEQAGATMERPREEAPPSYWEATAPVEDQSASYPSKT